jgi:hypothetical protein
MRELLIRRPEGSSIGHARWPTVTSYGSKLHEQQYAGSQQQRCSEHFTAEQYKQQQCRAGSSSLTLLWSL